jgi:hypothetical protein
VRKRKPEAVYLAEGSVLVKHTHDLELADRLARDVIVEAELFGEATDEERAEIRLGDPLQRWVRIIHCLPSSYGAEEGWSWTYERDRQGKPGVFRAVEYLR